VLTIEKNPATVQSLLESMADARRRSDDLFEIVRSEALYDRPIPERHRIIFYVGHLEAFDWNLVHENVFGLKSFHPEFDRLFAFGIDPVGGGLPTDQPSDWPVLEDVRGYVRKIRSALDEKLSGGMTESHSRSEDGSSLETLLNVAIEHRLMHVETLSYMLHQLPLDRKGLRPSSHALSNAQPEHGRVRIPEGTATLGLDRETQEFGWDNEFGRHRVQVPEFEIDRFMVTNRQFLGFIHAGGYETRELWIDDDWQWRTAASVTHPVFWKRTSVGWCYRGMFEEIPMAEDSTPGNPGECAVLDWPVYVSHAEAMAYARWAGKTLPTEEQWHRAAYGSPNGPEREYPWGNEISSDGGKRGNFDFLSWDPQPVNSHPDGQSAFGVQGMLGNGWEWTSSIFSPLPGFKAFPFYPGYSANFFDGKHFVIKGGSPLTAACMLRRSFRNWFQPHYQYVYAGFRCVNS